MADRRARRRDQAVTALLMLALLGALAGAAALLASPMLASPPLPAITPRTDQTPIAWPAPTLSIALGFAPVATPRPGSYVSVDCLRQARPLRGL
jgi:hypothetical protein